MTQEILLTNLLYFVKGLAIMAPIAGLLFLALWVDPFIAGAIMLTGFSLYFCWLLGYIISQKGIR